MPRVLFHLRRHAQYLAWAGLVAALLIIAPSHPVSTNQGLDQGTSSSPSGSPSSGSHDLTPSQATASAAAQASGSAATGPGSIAIHPVPVSRGGDGGPLPCLPRPLIPGCKPGWAGGPNGGVTGHNVMKDRVVIIWYVVYVDPSLQAAQQAAGTAYTQDQVKGDAAALQAFLRKNVQTYGRRLDVVPYFGSHAVTDDAGLKAEAVEMDQQLHAFAVTSSTLPVSLSDELIRRHVLAWNTFQQPAAYYASHAPYAWSVSGDSDLLNASTAEYAGKRLAGRPANFAGTGTKGKKRVFGLAYEGVLAQSAKDLISRMKAAGAPFAVTIQFGSDASTAEQGALNIVAQFKQAGVTTVICDGNVFAPLFLTQAADNQLYYPEYFVNGYQFQDAEEAARQYSPTQWNHAFGFTQIALRNDYKVGPGYAAAKQGNPSYEPSAGIALMFFSLKPIVRGIEAAGPHLDAFGFRNALFGLPALVGTPTEQATSYGSQGPGPYTGVDDFAEIWWNPQDTHTFDGRAGAYERTGGGRRYRLGSWPTTVPAVFS